MTKVTVAHRKSACTLHRNKMHHTALDLENFAHEISRLAPPTSQAYSPPGARNVLVWREALLRAFLQSTQAAAWVLNSHATPRSSAIDTVS